MIRYEYTDYFTELFISAVEYMIKSHNLIFWYFVFLLNKTIFYV